MTRSIVAMALTCSALAWAQAGPQPDMTVDAATRDLVIERSLALLNEHYVFPDVAKKMEEAVRGRQKRGEYDSIASALAFRARLEDDLRAVSKDKHVNVSYSAAAQPNQPGGDGPTPREREQFQASLARQNFCFERVERLAGNVGYVDLRCFGPPEVIAETVSAAFTFLGRTNALIVDLRENGGGDPAGVALVSSYLFDRPTHLSDIYFRRDGRTEQFWTLPFVPGRRLGAADVYVLTSGRTFSAGEEFSYNLKSLKRAKIIGEVTGGGAHPVAPHRIDDHFGIGVPFARPINPITRTNWEGTGVAPDETVPARQALLVAHLEALNSLRAKEVDLRNRSDLDAVIAKVRLELDSLRKQP